MSNNEHSLDYVEEHGLKVLTCNNCSSKFQPKKGLPLYTTGIGPEGEEVVKLPEGWTPVDKFISDAGVTEITNAEGKVIGYEIVGG